MNAWTPPQVLSLEQQRVGKHSDGQWHMSRGATGQAPLSLVRPDGVKLSIDFSTGKTRHRTTESGHGAQTLSKALGVRQFVKTRCLYPTIIDATGGLGQDAWALASTGCTLVLIERHPVIHGLLADGLARALELPHCAAIAQRIKLVYGDATRELDDLMSDEVHAIYLDPMYPDRGKKASSKKGMQFLHALLGPPAKGDSALLDCALACGVSRVVVKRPKGAPLLAGTEQFTGQRTSIDSPNTRYDIYHGRGVRPS
ncbi:MAG: class I SAM-dependent methyltransferase [Granulosicoccus sp.]